MLLFSGFIGSVETSGIGFTIASLKIMPLFSLAALRFCSLTLISAIWLWGALCAIFFVFLQFKFHWPSKTWGLRSFISLGKFSIIIFSNIAFLHFFSPFWDSSYTQVKRFDLVLHVFYNTVLFFPFSSSLCFSLHSSDLLFNSLTLASTVPTFFLYVSLYFIFEYCILNYKRAIL